MGLTAVSPAVYQFPVSSYSTKAERSETSLTTRERARLKPSAPAPPLEVSKKLEPRISNLSPLFLAQNLPGVVCPVSGYRPDAINICGMVTPLTAFVSLNGTLVSFLSVVCVVTLKNDLRSVAGSMYFPCEREKDRSSAEAL